jgi:tripartite-type tricarboxylate transporter receptor subunit TctC
MSRWLALVSVTAIIPLAGPSDAQDAYPNRPVKIIAPQAPGGGVDLVARIIADKLRLALGQPFVVDNQAGAGGAIATQMAARAQPDGYTLMIGYVATHATNPAVKRNLGYDAIKDFTPIAMIGGTPTCWSWRAQCRWTRFRSLLPMPRSIHARSTTATSGVGTLNHLVMEQFKHASGVPSMAVPYRSIGQAFTDAMGGQIQVIFRDLPLRCLTYVPARSRRSPSRATLASRSFPMCRRSRSWVTRLQRLDLVRHRRTGQSARGHHDEAEPGINKLLASRDVLEKFRGEALTVMPMTPQQFGKYIADEITHWSAIARASRIEAE